MSKKMLVAEGHFDEISVEEQIEEEVEVEEVEVEEVEVEEVEVEEVVDDFFCQFCSQGFVTEKGVTIHEKRWCKEKPVVEPDLSVVSLDFKEEE